MNESTSLTSNSFGGTETLPPPLQRFLAMFGDLTQKSVAEHAGRVYHDDVWFNDTLKTVEGLRELESYLSDTAENVVSCRVLPEDWSETADGLYLRWQMEIEFKKVAKGEVCRSIGMTHFRLAEDGRISYHQDYWDSASGFFDHVPILGTAIRWIRGRV